MRIGRSTAIFVFSMVLAGCAQDARQMGTTYLDRHADPNPVPADFRECHGFTCSVTTQVSLLPKEWKKVAAVFSVRPRDAKAERQRIALAVSVTRQLVGGKTGTGVHQWTHKDMRILPNLGDVTQLDCIDEAVNTWTYMTMMQRAGLFRFHSVAPSLAYGGTVPMDVNARNAAVLQDKSGDYFAVDPSLVDFGVPPPILPLGIWIGSWPPQLAATHATASGS